jgi:dextranase
MKQEDLFPAKSSFKPRERPSFYYRGTASKLHYFVYRLDAMISEGTAKTRHLSDGKSVFAIPAIREKGTYGIEIEGAASRITTAFEVIDTPLEDPHYGFLDDFTSLGQNAYLDCLLKFHINIVQAYDWMYRHEDYLAPSDPFVDPMGKTKSQKVVHEKIVACHKKGILCFAYGAIYGATNEFAALHPSWVFYDGNERPITFIDRFTIMNFVTSSWRECLLNNYRKAIEKLGFDGIHMDTYGSPKEAYSEKGELIRLDEEFVPLIDEAAKRLGKIGGSVTFNNVGGWPLARTATAKDAFDYVEIWDPLSDYGDLLNLVRFQRSLSSKPFVVAAYLKPYYAENDEKAAYANAYLSSLLYASGAHHLIYGEDGRALRTGYYCDNHKLSEKAFEYLRRYEDFACRYGKIIYDPELANVSLTHTAGGNEEYRFAGISVSVKPLGDSVLAIIREKKNEKVISLLNLKGMSSTAWNEQKEKPQTTKGPIIDALVGSSGWKAYAASPSNPRMEELCGEECLSSRGFRFRFSSGTLELWKLIVLRLERKNEQ